MRADLALQCLALSVGTADIKLQTCYGDVGIALEDGAYYTVKIMTKASGKMTIVCMQSISPTTTSQ